MMAHLLTDEELDELLKDPNPGTILGFGGYAYSHKVDIYSFYLTRKFEEIDRNYPLPGDEDNNKGRKGELLACGIIDLTMWLSGFYLGKDYTVIHEFEDKPGGNSVDFKLTCKNKVFLIEAKNWNIKTFVDKRTYDEKIRTRFFCKGKNILMIREDKVPDVEREFSLEECIHMGMPTWFITEYLKIHRKTVSRKSASLGYDRRSTDYKSLTKHRDYRYY
jgi:hypothetical protein